MATPFSHGATKPELIYCNLEGDIFRCQPHVNSKWKTLGWEVVGEQHRLEVLTGVEGYSGAYIDSLHKKRYYAEQLERKKTEFAQHGIALPEIKR